MRGLSTAASLRHARHQASLAKSGRRMIDGVQSQKRLLLAYAESSTELVKPLRRAFEAAGFLVDISSDAQPLPGGAIDAANAVVVCWTPAAVASDGVNLCAARAKKTRKLFPVLLAPCSPPAHLGGRFGADLSGWRGDPGDKEFLLLVEALQGRLSGRWFASPFWRSRYFSLGGAGAAALGAVAVITNFGDLRQTVEGFTNPGASEQQVRATEAKVDEVLVLLKQKSPAPLDPTTEAALRESIAALLSAQDGASERAAAKLESGDIDGALKDLHAMAEEGERAARSLAEAHRQIGALAYATDTFTALAAYERASQLAPDDFTTRGLLGQLYLRTGQLDEAEVAYRYIFDYAIEDEAARAAAAGSIGVVAMTRDDHRKAEQYFNYALNINRAIGNKAGEANDLTDLGSVAVARGEYAKARTLYTQALALQKQFGAPVAEAVTVNRIGRLDLAQGRLDAAEASFNRALTAYRTHEDVEGQSAALASLGDVARARKRTAEAERLYRQSLELARNFGVREGEAGVLVSLGEMALERGDRTAAIDDFRNARDLFRAIGLTPDVDDMDARLKAAGATPSPEGAEN